MIETSESILKTAVAKGLLTPEQVRECLSLHAQLSQQGSAERMADIVVRLGYLTPDQIRNLQDVPSVPGYEIQSLLGKGGMGAVFRARQDATGKMVALKVLAPELSGQKHLIQRFVRESRAATQIVHPNIVTAYEAGEASGTFYYAMEFVDGKSVDEMIRRNKQLDERVALDITRQIALALDAMHQMRMVHRDVKPQNIMISKNGVAKLCDLGLARYEANENSSLTATGTILGTPWYISPEQIEGRKDIDTRCDIYALGATLFAMLTGRPPFVGDSAMAIVAKHMKDPSPDVRQYHRGVSERTAQLIHKCMRKNRDDRFRSPKELVEAIDMLLSPAPPPTKRLARPTTMRMAAARQSSSGAPTGALAVALLLLVLGGFFVMNMGSKTSGPRRSNRPSTPEVAEEDPSIKSRLEGLQAAVDQKKWALVYKEAQALMAEFPDSPTIQSNRAKLEAWISDADAAERARREAMAKEIGTAKGLYAAGRWSEAAAALTRLLADYSGQLGSEENSLRSDLKSAQAESAALKAIADYEALPKDDWVARSAGLEKLVGEHGSTRSARAKEADWTLQSKAFKKEREAVEKIEGARKKVDGKDWAGAEAALNELRASYGDTQTVRKSEPVLQSLESQVNQSRAALTQDRLNEIFGQASRAYSQREYAKARELLLLAKTRFGTTDPYRAREPEVNSLLVECDRELKKQMDETARLLLAEANLCLRIGQFQAAREIYARLLTEFPDVPHVIKYRAEIEANKSACDKTLK